MSCFSVPVPDGVSCLMEAYLRVCLPVVVQEETVKAVVAVKCFMHEQHLSEKVCISCVCTTHSPCCPFALVFFKFPAFTVCDGWMLVWFGGVDGGYRDVFIKNNTKESFRQSHGAFFSFFLNICDLCLSRRASYFHEMIYHVIVAAAASKKPAAFFTYDT